MPSKRITASKHDSAGPAEIIVSKSVAKLRSIPTKQAQSLTNRLDRQQLIAIAAYYRAVRRGFDGGYEAQDWLEAEAEIDDAALPGGF
jgi:hypothetical protein